MNAESSQDLFSMWRPSSLPVLEQVYNNRIPLTLILSHGFSGKSLAVQLKGVICKIAGNVVRFGIESQKTIPTTAPAKLAQGQVVADVFFNMSLQKPGGIVEPMGYNGEASILSTTTDSEGKPTELLLRFGHAFNTRRMRRDERYDWRDDIPATLGLDLLNGIPQTRLELKTILSNCVTNNKIFQFSLLNISAGGVCIKIPPHATKSASSAIFFFLLSLKTEGQKNVPFFLLGKKLGLHYTQKDKEADGFRMQFTHELDWINSQAKLQWRDIEKTGSANLRSTLAFLMSTQKSQVLPATKA